MREGAQIAIELAAELAVITFFIGVAIVLAGIKAGAI